MTVGTQRRVVHAKHQVDRPPPQVVAVAADAETLHRIGVTLEGQGLPVLAEIGDPEDVSGLGADSSTVLAFACDVDAPREMTSLRRLRREMSQPAVVVISPPATGTGVRRALDAGADAIVFAPDLELTLPTAVRAVAIGQSVVPRKLRASVQRPVLSHRENQVLALVRDGLTNAEIAERLFLAESTIKSHLSSIFTKFGVRSRKEVAAVVGLDDRSGQAA